MTPASHNMTNDSLTNLILWADFFTFKDIIELVMVIIIVLGLV